MGEVLGCEVSGATAVMDHDLEKRIQDALDTLGFDMDSCAAGRLARYHAMLCDWNTRMNLTGDADFKAALYRHYLDSLAPLSLGFFRVDASVIDVGSGAGFPGLPLAIARPDLQVTLLDSLMKRVSFLSAVADELGLANVAVRHARAEDAGREPALRERFDVAVARAVAPLPVLCELMLPFVRVGGQMACYKGPAAQEELAAGSEAARLLGGSEVQVLPVQIPGRPDWQHCVIASRKKEKTIRQYPRKAGTPGRSPLGGFGKNGA